MNAPCYSNFYIFCIELSFYVKITVRGSFFLKLSSEILLSWMTFFPSFKVNIELVTLCSQKFDFDFILLKDSS